MIAAKRGAILQVASLASFMLGPLQAVYYASKAYVLSFSEPLRLECARAWLSEGAAAAWVLVYGLRALFMSLVVTYFLVRMDPSSLQWISAMAIPLALGDAWLVKSTGGKAMRRHLIIAAVLVLSTYAIHLWAVAKVSI
jgi:hypothetical protein